MLRNAAAPVRAVPVMTLNSMDGGNEVSENPAYKPPYSITPLILSLAAEIGEFVGRHSALSEGDLLPRLRRENRIRTLHASLAIENNTLTLEQVTGVIAGKRVLGSPREIQEVRNAFKTYESMDKWNPASRDDLLDAHRLLMAGLTDESGTFRSGGVGIFRGEQLVHMAPPAHRVPHQMDDLLHWLEKTTEHPLIAGCLVHYEIEFIHPFADGNGRMGRLWQTLVLRSWKPLFAYLPVETVIRERQKDYYQALGESDVQADAAPFIEFMLKALRDALRETVASDQVNGQVSDQVAALITGLSAGEMKALSIMKALGLSHRGTFRKNYLDPALAQGWIEYTQPDSPRSPSQRYRLTRKGKKWLDTSGKTEPSNQDN